MSDPRAAGDETGHGCSRDAPNGGIRASRTQPAARVEAAEKWRRTASALRDPKSRIRQMRQHRQDGLPQIRHPHRGHGALAKPFPIRKRQNGCCYLIRMPHQDNQSSAAWSVPRLKPVLHRPRIRTGEPGDVLHMCGRVAEISPQGVRDHGGERRFGVGTRMDGKLPSMFDANFSVIPRKRHSVLPSIEGGRDERVL